MLGELGGNGIINSLAASTASRSTPANTVAARFGLLACVIATLAAGRALAAAQPHTEVAAEGVVPSCCIVLSPSSRVFNSADPAEAKFSRIGYIISAGYIIVVIYRFIIYKDTK